MAGNSVPVFFGAKARTKRPPGLDVTSITDTSGSMGPYINFITAQSTFAALENALVAEGIGVLSTNRYSFTRGGGNTLSEIERNVKVNGVSTRWATGAQILSGSAILPSFTTNGGDASENMGLATNIVSATDRGYLPANQRIIISGSDEQSTFTAFNASPAFSYRYVGVHDVNLSISEPAGPNPVPAGTLKGFVYTTSTTGVAVYINGSTINNRGDVPVANVTATGIGGTRQENVNQARLTNGAIYDIDISFDLLGASLGSALGKFLFETS